MIRSVALLACASVALAWEAPCTVAGPQCTERLPLGPEGRFSLVYRSFPLTKPNPKVERALVVIHGAGRNADDYFASGLAGALIAGALDNTLVIAPRIASNKGADCGDELEPGEISWICGSSNDWRRGGAAHGIAGVYSYSFVDEILRKIAAPETFPNVRTIVVTGHSAGGQFTNRYAAATGIDREVQIPIKYVVSNPSSYLYLDETRLPAGFQCTLRGACEGEFVEFAEKKTCAAYNRWHYGLQKRAGYAAAVPDELLRKQLAARDVTYLLGELDTLPLFGFDSSCSAMAQGPNRLARGLAYWHYLRSRHEAKHKLVTLPACGHNGRCVYTSNEAFPVIFPQP